MNESWETELADLLSNLSTVQSDLLEMLSEKRDLLTQADTDGLKAIGPREQKLIEKLEACHQHRARLLERAASEGLPSKNLRALTSALPAAEQETLSSRFNEARARSRLLHHHSLTNWVLVQRTLIHLSQVLEIIATGGRPEPTYRRDQKSQVSGSLVDQAV